jgi:hypothetical protein
MIGFIQKSYKFLERNILLIQMYQTQLAKYFCTRMKFSRMQLYPMSLVINLMRSLSGRSELTFNFFFKRCSKYDNAWHFKNVSSSSHLVPSLRWHQFLKLTEEHQKDETLDPLLWTFHPNLKIANFWEYLEAEDRFLGSIKKSNLTNSVLSVWFPSTLSMPSNF